MPTNRLVEIPAAPARTRSRPNDLEEERARIRDLFRQAGETDRVIELTLGPGERDETVKMRYRAVAEESGCAIRFKTARQRPYRNSRGKDGYEAEIMLVFVTPPEPPIPAPQTRRRKAPASV